MHDSWRIVCMYVRMYACVCAIPMASSAIINLPKSPTSRWRFFFFSEITNSNTQINKTETGNPDADTATNLAPLSASSRLLSWLLAIHQYQAVCYSTEQQASNKRTTSEQQQMTTIKQGLTLLMRNVNTRANVGLRALQKSYQLSLVLLYYSHFSSSPPLIPQGRTTRCDTHWHTGVPHAVDHPTPEPTHV
jgi:hypothetical protein